MITRNLLLKLYLNEKNNSSNFVFFDISVFACSTIYNYDLSIGGLDDLPATKACLTKYLPKSGDAQKDNKEEKLLLLL